MPRWIEPKTDWISTDYEMPADFNRQIGNIEYIATFVLPLLNVQPSHQTIESVEYSTIPLPDLLNVLEANIEHIGRALSLAYPKAQLTLQQIPISGKHNAGQTMILPARISLLGDWKWGKVWRAGDAPNFNDTNRWENNMKLVHEWAKKQPLLAGYKPSGTFVAGQSNTLPRMVI